MGWGSILSTLLGALIGVFSTLAADWSRASRDRRANDQDVRRQTYADYLAALAQTRNLLRLAARSRSTPLEERARNAMEAFRDGSAYELRYQIALVAPTAVVDASTAAFRALRDLRDLVEEGAIHTEQNYLVLRDHWESCFAELRAAMKSDLAGVRT
ncbi:hypothetical protein [Streptomyces buecherae]|uniref:hypothetical protein n=1 Tax=Streptomyces buecherae TaxID=2763006 RepID=UPI003793498C